MKLKSLFYDSTVNFRSVSISKWILAILVGVLSSIVIYSFFYVLRETFRYLSIGFGNIPNIVTEENRNYYNIFFAGLSIIFGNSIALNFVFSKPQKITHRFNSKRKRLLNDNIFLSFNFSYWFTKIGLVFGIFSMCCMDFEFLPYFKSFSFLLLVVLYLESNKNLGRLLNNKKRVKFYLIHFTSLLLLTFILSELNVINYKRMDQIILSNNPNIDLPHSNFHNDYYNYRPEINLKLTVDSLNRVNIHSQDRKFMLNEISALIMSDRASLREEVVPFLVANIEANKDLNVKYIKLLESQLVRVNQVKVSYTVINEDNSLSRFERRGVARKLNPEFYNIKSEKDFIEPPVIPYYKTNEFKKNKIKDSAIISIGNNVKFNYMLVTNSKLKELFQEFQSNDFLFIYDLKENASYQKYIDVISTHFKAIYELRKEYQTIFQNNSGYFPNGYREEQRKLRDKFPIIIEEKIRGIQ